MQHTCATRLLTQELISAAASQTSWPRQSSASSVHSAVGVLGDEENLADAPAALNPADVFEQKASQEYMHTGASSSSSNGRSGSGDSTDPNSSKPAHQ